MIIGDVANIFVIINSLLYAGIIIASTISYDTFLYNERNEYGNKLISSNVLLDGFCVTNKDSIWLSSHAMCFYLDTFFCFLLYRCKLDGIRNNIPKIILEPVSLNILAHFGHGVGHFIVGYVSTTHNSHISTTHPNIILLTVFWYGFIRAIYSKLSWREHLPISALISFFQIFIPIQFGFTYVQTILLLLASINDLGLKKEDKNVYYTLKACIVNVPIGLVGWLEAYMCNSILIYIGGHVWYDCTIPISIMVYYFIAKTLHIERKYFMMM